MSSQRSSGSASGRSGAGLNGPDILPPATVAAAPACVGVGLLRPSSASRAARDAVPTTAPPPRAPAAAFPGHRRHSTTPDARPVRRPVRSTRARWPRPADLGVGVAWDFPRVAVGTGPGSARLRLVPTTARRLGRQPGTARPTPSLRSLARASPRLRRPVDRAAGPGRRALQPTLPGPPAATSTRPGEGNSPSWPTSPRSRSSPSRPGPTRSSTPSTSIPSGHYSRIAWLPILGPTSWVLLGTIAQHLARRTGGHLAARRPGPGSRPRPTRPARLRRASAASGASSTSGSCGSRPPTGRSGPHQDAAARRAASSARSAPHVRQLHELIFPRPARARRSARQPAPGTPAGAGSRGSSARLPARAGIAAPAFGRICWTRAWRWVPHRCSARSRACARQGGPGSEPPLRSGSRPPQRPPCPLTGVTGVGGPLPERQRRGSAAARRRRATTPRSAPWRKPVPTTSPTARSDRVDRAHGEPGRRRRPVDQQRRLAALARCRPPVPPLQHADRDP